MGADSSKEDNISQLGYEVGEEFDIEQSKSVTNNKVKTWEWKVHKGTRIEDEMPVTIFFYSLSHSDTPQEIRSSIQFIKRLRHPSILRYIDSCETEAAICLVTERVAPLQSNDFDSFSCAEICDGIRSILLALVFLHNKCHKAHNRVCLQSLHVALTKEWKLGGMECVTDIPWGGLEECVTDVTMLALPVKKLLLPDVLQFNELVNELTDAVTDDLGDLLPSFRSLCSSVCDEMKHLNVPITTSPLEKLLEHDLFKIDLIEIIDFLVHITLKSDDEKDEFFSALSSKLYNIGEDVVASRLLPLLMTRIIFLEPTAKRHFLSNLLSPSQHATRGTMSEEGRSVGDTTLCPILGRRLFEKCVVPRIIHIFNVLDIHIRLVLLTHIPHYAPAIPKLTLEEVILPQIWAGTRSECDELCSASLIALGHLVPILHSHVVMAAQLLVPPSKGAASLFTSGLPKLKNSPPPSVADSTTIPVTLSSVATNASEQHNEELRNSLGILYKNREMWSSRGSMNSTSTSAVAAAIVQPIRAVSPYSQGDDYVRETRGTTSTHPDDRRDVTSASWDQWDDGNEAESSEPLGTPQVLPPAAQSEDPLITSSSKRMPPPPHLYTPSDELGAGLDIKTVKVKKKVGGETEPDFFADLQLTPSFTWNNRTELKDSPLATEEMENKKFNVLDRTEESTIESGWEEANWDDF